MFNSFVEAKVAVIRNMARLCSTAAVTAPKSGGRFFGAAGRSSGCGSDAHYGAPPTNPGVRHSRTGLLFAGPRLCHSGFGRSMQLHSRTRATPVTHAFGPASAACFAAWSSLDPPPSLPPLRHQIAWRCSGSSPVLRGCPTSPTRASSASVQCLPDADQTAVACGRLRDLPVPAQGACAHARVSDRAGSSGGSRWRTRPYGPRPSRRRRHPQQTFAAQWLAYAFPCQRFDAHLAVRA